MGGREYVAIPPPRGHACDEEKLKVVNDREARCMRSGQSSPSSSRPWTVRTTY
jgi:hypothetical protein